MRRENRTFTHASRNSTIAAVSSGWPTALRWSPGTARATAFGIASASSCGGPASVSSAPATTSVGTRISSSGPAAAPGHAGSRRARPGRCRCVPRTGGTHAPRGSVISARRGALSAAPIASRSTGLPDTRRPPIPPSTSDRTRGLDRHEPGRHDRSHRVADDGRGRDPEMVEDGLGVADHRLVLVRADSWASEAPWPRAS